MFVGALFRDSSSKVLKHYKGLVEEVERKAEELAKKQLEEEENKHEYLDDKEQLEKEYNMLLKLNSTRRSEEMNEDLEGIKALVNTWATGGDSGQNDASDTETEGKEIMNNGKGNRLQGVLSKLGMDKSKSSDGTNGNKELTRAEKAALRHQQNIERRIARRKAKALKEAAKVVVDYRPVMSTIIDDYLFRCPTWQMASQLSKARHRRGKYKENIYMYRFSQPTHIPGYKECWGKVSCDVSL